MQWLTAGKGIVHSEMFPLLDENGPNRCELFQIWLNLPAADKMVEPYFTMLWNEDLPASRRPRRRGVRTDVTVIAGELEGLRPPPPPPDSWASQPDSDLAIWHIVMEPRCALELPPAAAPRPCASCTCSKDRSRIDDHEIVAPTGVVVRVDDDVESWPVPQVPRHSCCRAVRSANQSRSTDRSS